MFTSRAEFRLHLRIDNADRRLTPYGRRVGLISDSAWADYVCKQAHMDALKGFLQTTRAGSATLGDKALNTAGATWADLLRRPEVSIEDFRPVLEEKMPDFFHRGASAQVTRELKAVETEIKYAGYLEQQQRAIERLKKAEQRAIPAWFDYQAVSGLSREMTEKLQRVRPATLGQASRIPGVTPAAISLVNVYIEIQGKRRRATGDQVLA
jgi:tRNA uridine 5-carboxymethylaminomethyl modification enzyme